MAERRRIDRVNQLILEEVASVIQNELRDPAIGFITVVAVDTSPDMKNCIVLVSVLGDASAKLHTLHALNKAAPFIRKSIMPHLQLRIAPRFTFQIDDTAEHAARIAALLLRKPGEEAPDES